ncbi:MAG: HigA family addiction module antitoxin [Albidovulum sp.]|nr:HigA family addiction module antitoxin [Albidovulum sp.]MDE0306133.1 HigA family addiction module antitoxin [Albidovulum sp.]MDE0531842.1 HigA family addiction module antitoxin [Albidovulum sp.]
MTLAPTKRVATHPGALLREQIADMGPTVHGAARALGLPPTRLHGIAHERRGVSAETAISLGAYFGQTPEFWMNAQKACELSKTLAENGGANRARVRRRADGGRVSQPN